MNYQNRVILIVIYKVPVSKSLAYRSVLLNKSAGDLLLIYDNSPISELDVNLSKDVYYYQDIKNKGLSYAYNYAVKFCEQNNCEWLTIFDQDTQITNKYFRVLDESIKMKSSTDCFLPEVYLKNNKQISPFYIENNLFPFYRGNRTVCAINSGITLNVTRFDYKKDIFSNAFPLDFLDYSFFKKSSLTNMKVYKMPVQIIQNLSVSDYGNMSDSRFYNFITYENKFVRLYYSKQLNKYKLKLLLRIAKLLIKKVQWKKIKIVLKFLIKN